VTSGANWGFSCLPIKVGFLQTTTTTSIIIPDNEFPERYNWLLILEAEIER
jgi:hypothetical protein